MVVKVSIIVRATDRLPGMCFRLLGALQTWTLFSHEVVLVDAGRGRICSKWVRRMRPDIVDEVVEVRPEAALAERVRLGTEAARGGTSSSSPGRTCACVRAWSWLAGDAIGAVPRRRGRCRWRHHRGRGGCAWGGRDIPLADSTARVWATAGRPARRDGAVHVSSRDGCRRRAGLSLALWRRMVSSVGEGVGPWLVREGDAGDGQDRARGSWSCRLGCLRRGEVQEADSEKTFVKGKIGARDKSAEPINVLRG